MADVRLTRTQFADFLADFTNEVQEKRCKKLTYDLWRRLYNWAQVSYGWDEIHITKRGSLFEIEPWEKDSAPPDPVRIDKAKDPDFYNYLDTECKAHVNISVDLTSSDFHNAVTSFANSLQESQMSYRQAWDALKNTTLDYDDTAFGLSNYYYDDHNLIVSGASDVVEFNANTVRFNGETLEEIVERVVNNTKEKEKENKNIMTFSNFDFGPVDSSIHMSMYGMAVKNASGTYVSYDAENKQIIDVDILNFEGANKFLYKMPVAINEIAVGDIVVHARKPMFVVAVRKDDKLAVVDPIAGEEKVIMLTRSPFGFNFATKVVSFLNFGTANANAPFGNMLPLFLLNDNKNIDDILPLMFMMNGQNAMTTNPMLMYALMSKDSKAKDMLPFLLMMNTNPAQATGCCGGNCHCHEQAE